jgi:hypothetical protein
MQEKAIEKISNGQLHTFHLKLGVLGSKFMIQDRFL